MAKIDRRTACAFTLDASKLQRIVTIVEEYFEGNGPSTNFTLTLKDGRDIVVDDLEAVLAHDNTEANPIQSVSMIATGISPARSALVLYLGRKSDAFVHIKVDSYGDEDMRWAKGLFAALEEQTERTMNRGMMYREKAWTLVPLSAGVVVYSAYLATRAESVPKSIAIEAARLLEEMPRATGVEQKIDLALRMNALPLQKAVADSAPKHWSAPDVQTIVLLVPIVVTACILWYLAWRCYPRAVFAWGDMEKVHQSLKGKRALLWNVLWIGIALSLLTSVASTALSKYMGL
jgi:hypothetical protein